MHRYSLGIHVHVSLDFIQSLFLLYRDFEKVNSNKIRSTLENVINYIQIHYEQKKLKTTILLHNITLSCKKYIHVY